jgi:hypothetical protein
VFLLQCRPVIRCRFLRRLDPGSLFCYHQFPGLDDIRVSLEETFLAHFRADPVIVLLAELAEDQSLVKAKVTA